MQYMMCIDNVENDFKPYHQYKEWDTLQHKEFKTLYCEVSREHDSATYYLTHPDLNLVLVDELRNRYPSQVSKQELSLLMLKYFAK